jgi:hypothetical protein
MQQQVRSAAVLAALILLSAGAPRASAQEAFCGITPQSARLIAFEVIKQSGYAYDSVSSAYYVSVLASRLSPYYVVFFYKDGFVVGEMEVDLCGRQGTPHPGLQYAAETDILASSLLLEPDAAFAKLKHDTGAEAAFGSRVFPFGLTRTTEELASIDFWWLILDTRGNWHYMNKLGEQMSLHAPGAPKGR